MPEQKVAIQAAALGIATGLRTTAGLGALVRRGNDALPSLVRNSRARQVALTAICGELLVDKMPWAGSRLARPALVGRLVSAALATGLALRGQRQSLIRPIFIACAGALASAKVGHDVRTRLSKRRSGLVVALAEDAVALLIGVIASSPSRVVVGE